MSERIKREVVIPENRGFKGVWIPDRLYLTREFTPNEKFVLIEIYSLTRKDRLCYATNKHFSDFVGLSESAIKKMMAKFEKLGYISRTIEYKNGSKEIIRRFIKLTNKFYESFVNETEIPEENADGKADDGGGEKSPRGGGEKSPRGGGEKSPRGGGEKSPRVGEKSIQISNTDIKCNSISSNTDSNKVFSNEKTIYNNKVSPTRETYRSPDISYEYTEEEFKDFITKKTDHILHGIAPEEKYASVKPISAIISYFYKRYYECIGERHPILTDMVYAKIIMKLLDPSDEVYRRGFCLDEMAYSAMIDKFFQTDYGVKSGNFTDYRMPYFMQDTVQNNLVYSAGVV